MIRNPQEVERAKRKHDREHPLTQEQKYAVLNAMYEEAKQLGRVASMGAEDRTKDKLSIARILNAGV